MRTRNRHVSVWMTDEEYRYLKELSDLCGLGIDPLIRQLVAGTELRPRPPETYAALLRELSAIGNNINQLARYANTRKRATEDELQEAIRLLREAWRLVKDSF